MKKNQTQPKTYKKTDYKAEGKIDLELFKRYKKEGDEDAKDELILRQERSVRYYANRHAKWCNGSSFDDLMQEGWIGIMRAIEVFNPDKGVPFNYHASRWCQALMRKSIYTIGRTIRTPISTASMLNKIKATTSKLQGDLGREPSDEEIGEDLGLTGEKVAKYKRREVNSFSMDNQVNSEGDAISGGVANIVPISGFTPDEALIHEELLGEVRSAIAEVLTPIERTCIVEYFGISGQRKTLEEISDVLTELHGKKKITRQGVRVIKTKALNKIHKYLAKNEMAKID
jgi:RNA polymerase primary sigma factor